MTGNQAVTVTASFNGSSKTATVTVTPVAVTVSSLGCAPASVVSGAASTCTVTLSGAAPSGGSVVTVSDNSTALTAPASVTVASGGNQRDFHGDGGDGDGEPGGDGDGGAQREFEDGECDGDARGGDGEQPGLRAGICRIRGGFDLHGDAFRSGAERRVGGDGFGQQHGADVAGIGDGDGSGWRGQRDFHGHGGSRDGESGGDGNGIVERKFEDGDGDCHARGGDGDQPGLRAGICRIRGGFDLHGDAFRSSAERRVGGDGFGQQHGADGSGMGTVTVAAGATSATFTATAGTVTANQAVTVTASLNGSSKTASVTIQAALTISLAYGFEEGSGTTTVDVSGNGVTGQIQGATWTTSGAHGKALSFNGSNSYVDLGNPTVLQSTGSMTWSAWVKPTGNPPDDGQIIARSDQTTGWQLKISPDTGKRTFAIAISGDSASGHTQRYSKTVYSLNKWYYVAGVYDAAARKLDIYVNGVLDNGTLRGSIPAAQYVPALNATIGRRSGGFYFKGTIDDVRVYKRALTASEVQTDMNAGLTALPPASMTSAMVSADNGLAAVSPQIAAQAITPDPKFGNAVGALLCSPRIVKAGSQVNCELRLAGGANTARVELASTSSDVKVPRVVASRKRQSSLTFVASVEPAAKDQGVTITASLDGTLAQDNIEVSASPVPVLSVPEKQFARFGSRLTFTVTGADSGGLPIQLAATNLPPGAIFDPLSGVFEWTPDATQAGVYKVTFTGTNFVRRSASAQVSIDAGSGAPVLNAASTCSPGAIGTLEGKWISESAEVASDPSASGRELGGTRVKVNGSYVPLLLVSLTQAKFICPALEPGTALSVAVETATGTSEPLEMKMQSASPEIFSMDVAGRRQGVISFPNSGEMAMERNFRIAAHPAEPGDEILIWGTGFGSTPVGVRIGGAETEVVSVEAVPGQPGVYTIRALIPAFIASGQAVPVQLSTAGITSEAVTIAVEGAVQ